MTRRHRGDQVAPGEAGEDLTERTVSAPEVVAEVGPDRADRPVGQSKLNEGAEADEDRPLGRR